MELRTALKEQYHAGLTMLRQCVEQCPDDLWTSGAHPRPFWRIAFHAADSLLLVVRRFGV